jgi:hypothetical protein
METYFTTATDHTSSNIISRDVTIYIQMTLVKNKMILQKYMVANDNLTTVVLAINE